MTDYKFKITPNFIDHNSEGSLDTSLHNGVSIQRTGFIEVFNGTDRKIVAVKDNETFNNVMEAPSYVLTPVVTTDSAEGGYVANMTVYGTIVSQGSSPVSEYGWVWSYSENPTTSDNKVITGSDSFIGAYNSASSPSSMDPGEPIYVKAYATNSHGTSYGSQLIGEAYLCFVEGTMVTLSTGDQKPIEQVTYDDSLLVWNFDEGKFDKSRPLWICNPFYLPSHRMMKFSDGSELSVASFDIGHRIFNMQSNRFTNLNSPETPLGTETLTDCGKTVTLIGDELVLNKSKFYNIITHRHINIFANGLLTSCKLNNIYNIENMKYVKDERKLRTIEEFGVCNEVYEGLRLAEQPDYLGLKAKAKLISNSLNRLCKVA
jgi:hypothetical protein